MKPTTWFLGVLERRLPSLDRNGDRATVGDFLWGYSGRKDTKDLHLPSMSSNYSHTDMQTAVLRVAFSRR